MNKILLALLLIFLAASGEACSCSNGCQGDGCSCGCAADRGSFDVDKEVVIDSSSTIEAPCKVPVISVPVVTPPKVNIPTINVVQPHVCTITAPQVVAPPTIKPPTLILPTIQPPVIPIPQLPPQIPSPSCPPPRPTAPVYQPPVSVGPTCSSLSKIFTFSFQWACRSKVPFVSCEANIVWNNVIIASIVPVDYDIHLQKVNVTVSEGQNSLQIEGAGTSDSYGLAIDNVKLVRVGAAQNIVVNGDFQSERQYGGWNIYNGITGWQGFGIQVGWGDLYNVQWDSQVCELDGNSNFQLTQYFTFDASYNLVINSAQYYPFGGQTLTYTLQFDYAARKNQVSSPATSQAEITWNDAVVASLVASDYLVHHFSTQVKLKSGVNTLAFDAAGASDSYGLTVDNVKLYSPFNNSNLIANGDFSAPALGANNWSYINGGISGWFAAKAEAGDCNSIYNANWPVSSGQCIQLDSDSNQRYIQKIVISQALFTSLYVYIQNQLGISNAQKNLAAAAGSAFNRLNSAVARINDDIFCRINLANKQYSQYLQKLYTCTNQAVKDLHDDEKLVLNQYDYTLDAYGSQFGCSGQKDFDDSHFSGQELQNWQGHIHSISGKVITCHDDQGHEHQLQIAPCTHFEGQFPLPRIGDKIYWKGVPDKCGKTYVKIATTCNC